MKSILTCLTLLAVCATTRGQTQTLKKSERPVFYTAKALADDCRKFFKVFSEGVPLDDTKVYKLNPDDLMGAVQCRAYVAGMSDGMIENTFGPRYHPVKTELEDFGTLVSTFIKYVADHPEKQDFAASTLLVEANKIIAKAREK